jgi:uncharacterized membrane protein
MQRPGGPCRYHPIKLESCTTRMSTQEQKPGRWKTFSSLDWYDGAIEFLFRFVAKTSEPLLAAGIVYSAADVLSKGHLGSTNAMMDNLWAISQALAIESSGGVVLVYGLESFKAKDRVKAWMYLILSALLALTGGVMLFMQLAGLENQQADSPLMRSLFALRCVVSVGYIYLCRTKSMSFRDLEKEQPDTPATPAPIQEQQPAPIDYQRLAQELAPLLQAVRTTIIEEVKASIAEPAMPPAPLPERKGRQATLPAEASSYRERGKTARTAAPGTLTLEEAFQELLRANPGQRVSGRALARLAHIDRQTCTVWLKTTHPEHAPASTGTASQPQPAATIPASHPEMDVTATESQPEVAATEPPPAASETAAPPPPEPEVTATTGQPEATTATEPPPATTPAADQQPEATATASQPEPQAEPETSSARSEQTATISLPSDIPATGPVPEVTATETAITNQPDEEVTATEPATADQTEPTVTATVRQAKREKTATTSRPKAGATTTRKTAQSRPKATATRPAS